MDWVWFFFRIKGRVSRQTFFLGGLLLAVFQAFPLYRFSLVPQDSSQAQAWASVFFLVGIATLWSNVALGVKRLHDIDKPGLAAISLFVPIVQLIAFLVLCFFPGTRGPNTYGERTNAPA